MPHSVRVMVEKMDLEEAVAVIAREVYREGSYGEDMERRLFLDSHQDGETVAESVERARRLIVRQGRVAKRSGRYYVAVRSAQICNEVLVRHLPPAVFRELSARYNLKKMAWGEIESQGLRVENGLRDSLRRRVGEEIYYQEEKKRGRGDYRGEGENMERRGITRGGRGGRGGRALQSMKCYGCGKEGHPRRECPQGNACYGCGKKDHIKPNCPRKNESCLKCGVKGHTEETCRGGGQKEGRRGGNTHTNVSDFFDASELLKSLTGSALKEVDVINVVQTASRHTKVFVHVKGPNGVEVRALADTGATRTVVARQDVVRWGLKLTNNSLLVKGLTCARARVVETCVLVVGGVSMEVSPLTFEGLEVPTLVGMTELTRMGGYLDFANRRIISSAEGGGLASSSEGAAVSPNEIPRESRPGVQRGELMPSTQAGERGAVRSMETVLGDTGGEVTTERDKNSIIRISGEAYVNTMETIEREEHEKYTEVGSNLNGIGVKKRKTTADACYYHQIDIEGEEGEIGEAVMSIEEFTWIEDKVNAELEGVVANEMDSRPSQPEGVASTVTGSSLEEKESIMRKKIDHLPQLLKEKYIKLFDSYGDVWREPKCGKMKGEAHFKVTGRPVVSKQREITPEMTIEFEKQITDMLRKGVIRPSKSDYATVPVFVRKADGSWRMALDYRRLNQQLEFDAYPLPLLWDMVKRLAGSSFYTALDANWGFWNLRVAEESKKYTAIITPWGLYEFNVLPFGIKNSPGEFQRAMDVALKSCEFVHCYIDDITFGCETEEEHYMKLERVLRACREGGVFLKIEKAKIFETEMTVLGHKISRRGMSPDPKKVKQIRQLKAPRDKGELRSFLGAVQFLGRYARLAGVMAPMMDLCKKNARFIWKEIHQAAFETVKLMLSEKLCLSLYDNTKPLGLATDASGRGIGACLFQSDKGTLVPLEFYSKKLTEAEMKYDIREKEMLAVKKGLEHFETLCKSTHTSIFTDHESLRWMWGSDRGRIQRWSLYIQQFSLTMFYLPGKCNVIADWLSRCIDDNDEANHELETICLPEVWYVESGWWKPLEGWAAYVPTVAQFVEATNKEVKDSGKSIEKTVIGPDGLRRSQWTGCLYVPELLRESVTYWFHVSTGGHRGVSATVRRMRSLVFWPKMNRDIAEFIKGCPCQRMLSHKGLRAKKVKGVLESPSPHDLISIDFVGPKKWRGEEFYITCIVDHCTRYMWNRISSTATATQAIEALVEYCGVFGAPMAVLHDRGSAFESKKFIEVVTQQFRAYSIHSSPYYPQGNGINESSHQSINRSLASMALIGKGCTFKEAVQMATWAYNATPHGRLGASPHFAMFGCEMGLPGWQKLTLPGGRERKLASIIRVRLECAVRARLREFETFRPRAREGTEVVKEGDWVRFKLSPSEAAQHSGSAGMTTTEKLQPRWSLPAKVLEVKDKQLTIQLLGRPNEPQRDIALTQVEILPTEIPQCLAELQMENIVNEAPRVAREHLRGVPKVTGRQAVGEVVTQAVRMRAEREQRA